MGCFIAANAWNLRPWQMLNYPQGEKTEYLRNNFNYISVSGFIRSGAPVSVETLNTIPIGWATKWHSAGSWPSAQSRKSCCFKRVEQRRYLRTQTKSRRADQLDKFASASLNSAAQFSRTCYTRHSRR
jgi:hypothetical protein